MRFHRSHLINGSLGKAARKFYRESQTMLSARSRGFDWKEVAEVLRLPRGAARGAFWSEIRRSSSKRKKAQSPAIVIQEERGPKLQKVRKHGGSR
jgi:hypothetical protein